MTQPPESFPSDSFPTEASWAATAERIEHQVRHCHPVTRDLNRHLTDLLGPCPVTGDGRWVHFVESVDFVDGAVEFPALPVNEALRLATALQTINADLELSEVRSRIPAAGVYAPSSFAASVEQGVSRFHVTHLVSGFRADS